MPADLSVLGADTNLSPVCGNALLDRTRRANPARDGLDLEPCPTFKWTRNVVPGL